VQTVAACGHHVVTDREDPTLHISGQVPAVSADTRAGLTQP